MRAPPALKDEHTQELHYWEGAQWRLDAAPRSLDEIGPIGRRTHRSQRRELKRRIEANRPATLAPKREAAT